MADRDLTLSSLPPSSPTFLSLPEEILEEVIVSISQGGSASSISVISQVCRSLRQFVYLSPDGHLWRRVFLATFDDPRVAPILRDSFCEDGGPSSIHHLAHFLSTYPHLPVFQWRTEYQRRIASANSFKRAAHASAHESSTMRKRLIPEIMPAVLSVLTTSLPCMIEDCPEPQSGITSVPIFPPLLRVSSKSLNAAWISSIFEHGYLPQHVDILTHQAMRPNHDDVLVTLCRVLFLYGFIPSTHLHPSSKAALSSSSSTESSRPASWVRRNTRLQRQYLDATDPLLLGPWDVFVQRSGMRLWARRMVYDMSYISSRRLWGPFLPITQDSKGVRPCSRSGSHSDDSDNSHEDNGTEDEEVGDSEAAGPSSDATLSSSLRVFVDEGGGLQFEFVPTNEDGDSDGSDDDDDDFVPLFHTHEFRLPDAKFPHTHLGPAIFPTDPILVRPDYVFLSAARILVIENLREKINAFRHEIDEPETAAAEASVVEMFIQGATNVDGGSAGLLATLDALQNFDLTRMGGVPGFWRTFDARREELQRRHAGDGGQASHDNMELSSDEVDGWDWAGVTGTWRRTVCWLDYSDLRRVQNNGLSFSHVQETMRMFAMNLRVTGYSPPLTRPTAAASQFHGHQRSSSHPSESGSDMLDRFDPDALVWQLPIIHVEGESRGSDVDLNLQRKLKGTVRMIADGVVRWSMYTTHPENDDAEWLTEGVQIGEVGSAAGFIGLWTAADHESGDPIGPFWAWKVSE
ncbi:hypothetical protein FISHEDRAFT_73057 [Fistulina hepatica ATCC 64428]|uniref:F-box domain-containing protein n=1 Tax=Fistulina hepatica ATCC 64428 TaxID=1128425 RepID=A0A0D7ABA5_9AGAR|nr:hypothetical protein FISHEDRAFT_74884 [Fistulina hepatica ATCC 64428]KIY49016.1 hypothetical protein FISHEDRAFT_73057 [Fistulina hepatica ATCC 64428]